MAFENGEVFTMIDEDGTEQEVEVMAALDLENRHYIAIAYSDELENEDSDEDLDVFFMQVKEDNELAVIENDEDFAKVSLAFEAALEEAQHVEL
jgi:uncharacterized protein YrzB (UPF0473 family)